MDCINIVLKVLLIAQEMALSVPLLNWNESRYIMHLNE